MSDAVSSADKVLDRAAVAEWRGRLAGPLVFTNGVFDLLHPGHVDVLEGARAEGAHLVVGINSDASVRRLGRGRIARFVPSESGPA